MRDVPSEIPDAAECCFCETDLKFSDSDALTVIVLAASRSGEATPPTQQLWCHADCLAIRLRNAVPFDPEAFFD